MAAFGMAFALLRLLDIFEQKKRDAGLPFGQQKGRARFGHALKIREDLEGLFGFDRFGIQCGG